ncbi:hypothetical protein [Polyangium fumosum]|uniref:Lipoprotein n=1 Tax=Polyangium fumosum TaxID=889272 RepID=A0A4U1IMW7_9BACT|nr:hypothetical protein [Polyangium fumosum]TKC95165.1 hypothetical protein E8A74_47575 [Polyangium fumosum]
MPVSPSRLVSFALLPALLAAGCGPDEYTCQDEIPTTVTVSPKGPIEVDSTQPDAAPRIDLTATFQVSGCNRPADSLEIASAKVVDFYDGEKFMDISLRFAGGVEGAPTCDNGVGAYSLVEVVATGVTNGELLSLCGRENVAIETLIKRAGCADTDPATRTSKTLIKVVCP